MNLYLKTAKPYRDGLLCDGVVEKVPLIGTVQVNLVVSEQVLRELAMLLWEIK